LTGAPANIDQEQINDLGLKLNNKDLKKWRKFQYQF
jgi:hypothetical protein